MERTEARMMDTASIRVRVCHQSKVIPTGRRVQILGALGRRHGPTSPRVGNQGPGRRKGRSHDSKQMGAIFISVRAMLRWRQDQDHGLGDRGLGTMSWGP